MTGEPWDQLPLFDDAPYAVEVEGLDSADDLGLIETERPADEGLSKKWLDQVRKRQVAGSVDSRQGPVDMTQEWRKHNRQMHLGRRKLPPRVDIKPFKNRIFDSDDWQCLCGRRPDEINMHAGHILSRDEAFALMYITGEQAPWRLVSQPEDYFAQCAKHNIEQGGRSLPLDVARHIVLRSKRPWASWSTVEAVLFWCQKAEEWRPCR